MSLEVEVDLPGRLVASLTADPGEVVVVIGPNGSGKTTLLQAVAGIVPARRVVVGGEDLTEVPVHRRRVGHLVQEVALFPHLSTLDNVAFGPRARGASRAAAREAAQVWLDRLGVGDLADRPPQALSGGQAQRVGLARALATEPAVLLLDEPFASLDVGVATALRLELARHLRDFPGVTLLVTHDPLDALTLADRLVVLDEGRVAQEGLPAEVAARPATEHVARLVGLNVVDTGTERLVFRPSAVTVDLTEPHGSPRYRWPGRLVAVTPHGDALRLLVDGEHTLLADVTPAAAADLGLVPGLDIWLSVKSTAVRHHGFVVRDR